MKRGQAYSFGGKPKEKLNSLGPGPGNYVPPDPSKYRQAAPAYSIKGSGGHDFLGKDARNAPGPGQYNGAIDTVKGKAPAFTMGGRRGSGRYKTD
jgi:hypothetical protein